MVDEVRFDRCGECGSICADAAYLAGESGDQVEPHSYDDAYWRMEIDAARERSYGSSISRVAETFLYCRRPIGRFLDISTGPGLLLDALTDLLGAETAAMFHGIEPFPPPEKFRSRHPNYQVGFLSDLKVKVDAGVCIEVIEHLTPDQARTLARDLAAASNPGALFYFNSAQPGFVIADDFRYLDPKVRGHIASYSIDGVRKMFEPAGFTIHALPGRDWAFLAEFAAGPPENVDQLMHRVWHPVPENLATLRSNGVLGEFVYVAGREGAVCYAQTHNAEGRAVWAHGLLAEIDRLHRHIEGLNGVVAALSVRRSLASRIKGRLGRLLRIG